METFLQGVVGAVVWVLANAVYIDLRRRGVRGFGRFAAFWAGFPVNFFWRAVVKEARLPRIQPPDDDEDALLGEIRRDRQARGFQEGGSE